jgi:hypothetical protein
VRLIDEFRLEIFAALHARLIEAARARARERERERERETRSSENRRQVRGHDDPIRETFRRPL